MNGVRGLGRPASGLSARVLLGGCLGILALLACGRKAGVDGSASGGSRSAGAVSGAGMASVPGAGVEPLVSASAVRSPGAARVAPRDIGSWIGSFETSRHVVQMTKEEGAVGAWQKDPGNAGTGKGSLSIAVAEDGTLTGSGSGSLGDLRISGACDDDRLTVHFGPATNDSGAGFSGYAEMRRQGAGWEGRIYASNGDSTLLREGRLSLVRASR